MSIHDHQSIRTVTHGKYGRYPMRFWDDGFGPLWVYSESLGPLGIVRAQTREDALSCVIDEIMDDADEEDVAAFERGESDGVYVRSNGIPSNPHASTMFASEDLNGSRLEQLTADIAREHRILVRWE